jgi:hypothetical protein
MAFPYYFLYPYILYYDWNGKKAAGLEEPPVRRTMGGGQWDIWEWDGGPTVDLRSPTVKNKGFFLMDSFYEEYESFTIFL